MKTKVTMKGRKKMAQVIEILLSMRPEELKEVQLWLREFIEADKLILKLVSQMKK